MRVWLRILILINKFIWGVDKKKLFKKKDLIICDFVINKWKKLI